MAGGGMAAAELAERRVFGPADIGGEPTARVETAAGGWVVRARQIAGDRRGLFAPRRIGHGRQQRLRVGMLGALPKLARWRALDDAAEIHDEHAIGEIAHD